MQPALPFEAPPILNITGEKVALGPLRRDLLPRYQQWNNDLAAIRLAGMKVVPQSFEAAAAWYERLCHCAEEVWFTIYERATLQPIGLSILLKVDTGNCTASFAIGIGEEHRGRGYGTEATLLTLRYAFHELGLHNVMLRVYACNERAIRAYTRAGFRVIGRRRESVRLGSELYDNVFMDCLATEFERPALRCRLDPAPTVEARGGETAP